MAVKSLYTVESRREVSEKAAAHAGEKAVLAKLESGYMAWGFASEWEDAERNAVASAETLVNQR